MLSILSRLVNDRSGGPAMEYALLLALVAAIAGFGMISLGDSLGGFYDESGTSFEAGAQFPGQGDSQVLNDAGSGDDDPRCVEVDSNCVAGRD